MNTTRPKSLLRRRNNKHRSVARKIVIQEQRRLAAKGKVAPAKVTTVKIETPVAEKPVKKGLARSVTMSGSMGYVKNLR